jgi:hypothetical protein
VPQDLPEIVMPPGGDEDKEGTESQWEKRATLLARENEKNRSRPGTPVHGSAPPVIPQLRLGDSSSDDSRAPQSKAVSSKEIDEDIQEAIRLHEEGKLAESTALFGRLADPKGANNPLSQVLYGLALRYVRLRRSSRAARDHMGDMHLHHAGAGAFVAGTHRMAGATATQAWNCPITTVITYVLTRRLGTDGGASRIRPRP